MHGQTKVLYYKGNERHNAPGIVWVKLNCYCYDFRIQSKNYIFYIRKFHGVCTRTTKLDNNKMLFCHLPQFVKKYIFDYIYFFFNYNNAQFMPRLSHVRAFIHGPLTSNCVSYAKHALMPHVHANFITCGTASRIIAASHYRFHDSSIVNLAPVFNWNSRWCSILCRLRFLYRSKSDIRASRIRLMHSNFLLLLINETIKNK